MKFLYPVTCVYIFIISHDESTLAMPPLTEPFGSGGTLQSFRQQAQFSESIRNWFIKAKDHIFGNPNSPDFSTLLNQAKEDYKEQKKLVKGFWLDLTQLSFDPDRDWGFHLGPWYIIKKSNDNSNTDNRSLSHPQPENIDSSKTEWNHDFRNVRTWPESISTVKILVDEEITTQTIEDNTIPNIDTDKNENVSRRNNNTFSHSTSDESARMLPQN